MKPINVTDLNFTEEVLESQVPVLVDFWAPWCAPCKAIAPVLEELAEEFGSRLKIVKVNADENRATAMKYNISSIPTLLLFKNGELLDETIGAAPRHLILGNINYYLPEITVLN